MLSELAQGRQWSGVIAVPANLKHHMRMERMLFLQQRQQQAVGQHAGVVGSDDEVSCINTELLVPQASGKPLAGGGFLGPSGRLTTLRGGQTD